MTNRAMNCLHLAAVGRRRSAALSAAVLVLALAATAAADDYLKTGTYTGTGNATLAVSGLGFRPEVVIVKSSDSRKAFARTSTMPAGLSKNLAKSSSLESSRIVSIDADGFTVGNDSDINKAGIQYYWVAMKAQDGLLEVGQYTGTGVDSQPVPLLNLTPEAVLVLPDHGEYTVLRHADMVFRTAYNLDNGGAAYNSIVGLGPNVFNVSPHKSTNEVGKTYHYIAWQSETGSIALGSYLGDGQSARNITGLEVDPEYVLIANSSGKSPVHRPATLAGDVSLYFRDLTARNNLIRSMADGTFQTGNDPSVNSFGTAYFWLALGNPGAQADLALTMNVDDDTPLELQTVSLSLMARNNGPDAATTVQVTDFLPAGLTFLGATPSRGTYDNLSGIWSIGTVSNGGTPTLTIEARVEAGTTGQTLVNSAVVTSSSRVDMFAANDTAAVAITVLGTAGADLRVTKTVDDRTPNELQALTYVVTLTNLGPENATGVRLDEIMPSQLTVLSSVVSSGSYDSGLDVWNVGSIDAGDSYTLTTTASVHTNTAGLTITNTAGAGAADQPDPNSANNSAAVEVVVNTVDMQVVKLVDETNPAEGATVTYTVVASNLGPAPGTQIKVSDLLPAGLTFQSAVPSAGSYTSIDGVWNIGAMAASTTENLTLKATVNAGTVGNTIANTASLTDIQQLEVNPANNTGTADLTVAATGGVDLQLSNVVDLPEPNVGDMISYTITVFNAGTGTGTGIIAANVLPPEVTYVSAFTNKGSFDQGTGLWTIGTLAEGFQAVLNIHAFVDFNAVGAAVVDTARIVAADQPDPQPGDNLGLALINVPSSDLTLAKTVDQTAPAVGDTVTYRVVVGNDGPNPASGIRITDLLPPTTALVSAATTVGSYDGPTGVWTVGSLNPALADTLTILARVGPAAAGLTVANTAVVSAADQADLVTANNTATANIMVPGADLAVSLVSDVLVSFEGSLVNLKVSVTNNGASDAAGVSLTQLVPAGLTFQSATPSQGSYLEATGVWNVGFLANAASATLDLVVRVAAGTGGTVINNLAAITAADPADPNAANNTASVALTIWAGIPAGENILWPLVGPAVTVRPGASGLENLLTFVFVNRSAQADTLHGMTLTNLTTGGGTAAQLDAEWQALEADAVLKVGVPAFRSGPTVGAFVDGRARFDRLQWAVPAGDTLTVTVRGAASLRARDAARLRTGIVGPGDLVLNGTYMLVGSWPLVSGQSLIVDGFVAAQARIIPRASALLPIGSQRNLALTVDLPGNGYLADVLTNLALQNRGTAETVTDIARILAWADDGDTLFDPARDILLGAASNSGDRWQLSGLNVPVPAAGRRFYATVDIAETARPTRDIRLRLPSVNGYAVEMASGNDGPVDAPLENPNTLGISVNDRVVLTPEWFLSGVALPGADDVPLLQFVVSNTYTDLRRLRSLTFTNTTVAPAATAAQRDAICQQVDLRLDGNGNGKLDDVSIDPRLASGTFGDVAAGRVNFSGLDLALPAGSSSRLFVTADVGLMTAADGDRIKGELSSVTDISFQPVASVVAAWPLQSGTEWVVNGMIREQVTARAISVLTLGPGEGPVLAMDLKVPANGYAADELSGLSLVNDGSALAADLQLAELWADNGDGVFDAGSDLALGPLTVSGNRWTSNVLAVAIPAEGLRLFASLTVAASPRDSVTVKLGVPIGGITVSSGNDGPLDQAVPGSGTLVISTSPLRTSVDFATAATDTGQAGTITMNVRNAGSETVTSVIPALEFVSGSGLLVIGAPVPAFLVSLDPGEQAVYSWPFVSSLPGLVVLQGNAQGQISGGQVRRSIVTPTSAHRIYTPVPYLELYPTVNLPFSLNRGQAGLVPLTLTFRNPGSADVANAQLTSIRVRLLQTAAGPGIVPGDLLDRVIISEGTNIYLATTALPTSGDEIDLVFSQPVTITGSEPVTLGLRLDLRLNSTVPSFLVSIEDATWLVGNDAVNGAGLATVLGQGSFPIRTGQATLVSPAAGLNVAVADLAPGSTVPGQNNVQLAEINLSQSLAGDSSSAIDVGRLAFVFHGADGLPVPDPAVWFNRLSLQSAFQEHFAGSPVVEQDSLVVLQLSSPLTISGSANLVMRLLGDVAADSPLGEITPLLAPVDNFDARDGNMNNPVPVILTTSPAAAPLTILGPASTLSVAGSGVLPAQVARGTRDLTALTLGLANPGPMGTAPVVIDTLTLRFFNSARQPLDPDNFLDRLRVMQGATVVGTLIEPGAVDGQVAVPLTVAPLAPGAVTSLRLSFDVKTTSPTGTLEVVVDQAGIRATDSITAARLTVTAAAGFSLPVSSGVATLVVPADELRVAASSLMPPLLAVQPVACPVLALEFTNPAGAGSGDIELSALTLVQAKAKANAPDLARFLSVVQLRLGDTIIAGATGLAPGATSVTLVPTTAVLVQAGQTVKPVLEIFLKADAPPGQLQLALDEAGVGAGPPGGSGLVVRVLPVSGTAFPFTTAVGNVAGGTLADSYANFPNPFAAGREPTTFAFSLLQAAKVSLRLVTPHGELVATVLQDEPRAAGFHQTDTWLGLNGNGIAVHNGVYLAELVVLYADGTRERILRKVAVVR